MTEEMGEISEQERDQDEKILWKGDGKGREKELERELYKN